MISQYGKIIRMDSSTIRESGRAARGVRFLHLEPVDRVAAAVLIPAAEEPINGNGGQMQSGIVSGLTAALKGAITINKGRVEQGNFDDYQMLRVTEMPKIEVHIVPSDQPSSGIGEPGTPPIAPAVCNAIFAATRKRIRQLPIWREELV